MKNYYYHIGNMRVYTESAMKRSPRLSTEFVLIGEFKNRTAAIEYAYNELNLYLK